MIAKIAVQDFAQIVEQLKAARSATGGSEKRRGPRMAISATLGVTALAPDGAVGRSFRAFARDISMSGIGLFQSVLARVGQELVIALPRHGEHDLLYLRCIVVFCAELGDGLYGIGAEFAGSATPEIAERIAGQTGATPHPAPPQVTRVRERVPA
jgi:hypothetical protein